MYSELTNPFSFFMLFIKVKKALKYKLKYHKKYKKSE